MKAVVLLAVLGLAACSAAGSSSNPLPAGAAGAPRQTNDLLGGAPRARLTLSLFDAPLANVPGAKVNVALDGVQLITSSGVVQFITNKKPQVVNLLDLQDDALKLDGTAPVGQYTGIRMLVDTANSGVTIAGRTFPIVWGAPGHASSSPVVAVDFSCAFTLGTANGNGNANASPTKIALDFNVMQSVRFVNGIIYVQPSVTAANAAGQVEGTIRNAAGKPVSNATVLALDHNGHTVNATATKTDGSYVIHALPPGMYTIAVKNSYVTANGETITAVNADAGAAPSAAIVISPEDELELDTLVD